MRQGPARLLSANLLGRTALVTMSMFVGLFGTASAFASPSSFVSGLWPLAQQRGVSRGVFDAALAGFQPSPKIMELTGKQPEFTTTVGQYVGKRITGALVEKGRAMAGELRKTLAAIEQRYGVDAEA